MNPINGQYLHLFTTKFQDGLIIVPSRATHFIISAHRMHGNDKIDLNHAVIKILRDGVVNPNFDCILPASDIIALPHDIKPGISGITYAAGNTEPELVSFYEYQINRKIFN